MPDSDVVLLFSGGRDSTLACLRMIRAGLRPTLLTVSSSHLVGLSAVRRRLQELQRLLPSGTTWINVQQPELADAFPAALPTCLPCHLSYVVAGVKLARRLAVRQLAFGYTSYQGAWAEQTPLAIGLLSRSLGEIGMTLTLPVQEIQSKAAAVVELREAGLTPNALEQKCLQQQHNLPLAPEPLKAETVAWAAALQESLARVDTLPTLVLAEEIVA
jgi:hypothetical protein